MTDFSFGKMLSEYNKELRILFGKESREVPQKVKTEVHRRARGRCEWKRCKRKGTEFHHWARDRGTVSTTALLCHKHHRDEKYKTHRIRRKTDMYGRLHVTVVRKRIPIPKRTIHKTRTRQRRSRRKIGLKGKTFS